VHGLARILFTVYRLRPNYVRFGNAERKMRDSYPKGLLGGVNFFPVKITGKMPIL